MSRPFRAPDTVWITTLAQGVALGCRVRPLLGSMSRGPKNCEPQIRPEGVQHESPGRGPGDPDRGGSGAPTGHDKNAFRFRLNRPRMSRPSGVFFDKPRAALRPGQQVVPATRRSEAALA
jgi:hypothetical protein